ncbi:unnamed protein product [Mycena citricolor]|uniref:RING-type domain-containing protein n=1 Tax=Mycena citricolor TaxID=2018698 RepID=A0AAD2HUJ0_9AGAR|nr:unnamed protein product [Mycena citricolor]
MSPRTSSKRKRSSGATRSSQDDVPVIISSTPPPAVPAKKPRRPATVRDEVIEISSDEEDTRPRKIGRNNPDQRSQLQQEICALKSKCAKLERVQSELEDARKEIAQLKRPGKIILDAINLDDHICCEICSTTMWKPYILNGCGHTFCLDCLVEWLSTCLAQHMNTHPHERPGVPNLPPAFVYDPRNPVVAAMVAQHHQTSQPQYTCPSCRKAMKSKPTEDFALKALIHTLAAAIGQSDPKEARRRGKGRAVASKGPFDSFFGKE